MFPGCRPLHGEPNPLNRIVAKAICVIIIRRVKKMIMMWLINKCKSNTIVFDRKTITFQLVGTFIHNPCFLLGIEISDGSADIGVCL